MKSKLERFTLNTGSIYLQHMFKLPLNLIMINFNNNFNWQNPVKMTKLFCTACEVFDQRVQQFSLKLSAITTSSTTQTDGLIGPDGDPILTVTPGRTGNWKLKALIITIYITNNKLIFKMVFQSSNWQYSDGFHTVKVDIESQFVQMTEFWVSLIPL